MSIIFKKKKYNRLIIFFKAVSVFLVILTLMLISLNHFLLRENTEARNLLNNFKEEELKYISLISEVEQNGNLNKENDNYFNLIFALIKKADSIIYNSIQIKDNYLNLYAESSNYKSIFILEEKLKQDRHLKEVELAEINKNGNYQFKIKAVISLQ